MDQKATKKKKNKPYIGYWFVYIIRCVDQTLYTGITNNLKRRFSEHQSQGKKCAKYLRGKQPLTLVYQKSVRTRSEALQLEAIIKKLPKVKKELLVESLCRKVSPDIETDRINKAGGDGGN